MKVMLICPILDCQPVASVGIASLSTHLRKSGHQVKLILINNQLKHSLNLEEIYKNCCEFSPDIIGLSSVNSQYEVVIKIADYLKKRMKTPIFYGGSCPTVRPEECLSNESIDYVCVGEGEEALVEFLDRYERGGKCFDIANIWAKQNGKVIKNPVRPLAELNSFYPLDFSVFEEMEQIVEHRDGWFDYSLTRGCPYNCSYCQSAHLHKIYNKKYSVRYVSLDTAIENLLGILKTYRNIKFFNINDDTLNLNKKYLLEFCNKYKNNIFRKYKIKFNVLCRVDLFDEEVCKNLKEAGVRIVKFGVESGSLRIRKQILNRNITDETIINAFRICDKYKVETWTFNMIGLPTETKEDLDKTFKLNAILKPDNFWLSIYYPIDKTALYDFCMKNNLIKYDMLSKLKNYRTDSPLVSKHFKDGEIKLIYQIAGWILNSYAFKHCKNRFSQLISKVKKQAVDSAEVEEFVNNQNKELDKELVRPYYSQRFKHIAIKVTDN